MQRAVVVAYPRDLDQKRPSVPSADFRSDPTLTITFPFFKRIFNSLSPSHPKHSDLCKLRMALEQRTSRILPSGLIETAICESSPAGSK